MNEWLSFRFDLTLLLATCSSGCTYLQCLLCCAQWDYSKVLTIWKQSFSKLWRCVWKQMGLNTTEVLSLCWLLLHLKNLLILATVMDKTRPTHWSYRLMMDGYVFNVVLWISGEPTVLQLLLLPVKKPTIIKVLKLNIYSLFSIKIN